MKKIYLILLAQAILIVSFAQTTFKTGVNFPFRTPQTTSLNDFLYRLSETGTPAMRQMTYADVYWRQVEPTDNNWNFTNSDSAYLNPYNITPIGELFAIGNSSDTIGIQVPWNACSNVGTCYWDPATDSVVTKDYISTVVNRYKNVTKYWEITNEFENAIPPAGLPLLQKRNFLQYCHDWIKQSDTASKVILPALLGTYGYPITNSFNWLRNFLNIGGGSSFDIMNYHDYNSWWTLPAHTDSVRAILNNNGMTNTPIWITETSISSVDSSAITPNYSSVDEQAADVWRRLSLLWGHGAEVAFWHSHWSSGDLTGWGEFGLLDNFGKKKKSFHSFKLLIDKVSAFSSINVIQEGAITNDNNVGGDGVWVIKFVVNGQNKWLIWSPDNQSYNLTGLGSNITVSHVVPTNLLANGDSASFQIDTFSVTNGNYAFNNLTSLPILVEPFVSSIIAGKNQIKELSVFPNPSDDQINININSKPINDIQLFNSLGQDVTYMAEIHSINHSRASINISKLPNGIYILKIKNTTNQIRFEKL